LVLFELTRFDAEMARSRRFELPTPASGVLRQPAKSHREQKSIFKKIEGYVKLHFHWKFL